MLNPVDGNNCVLVYQEGVPNTEGDVKSGARDNGKSWVYSFGDSCVDVIRWVKTNPVKSLFISVAALTSSYQAVVYGTELNSRRANAIDRSKRVEVEIPNHLLESEITKDIFINTSEVGNHDPRAIQKDGECTANPQEFKKFKKAWQKQKNVLTDQLKFQLEQNKKVLLNDMSRPDGLISLVDKLEKDVDEILSGRSGFDPRYYNELQVISFNEYKSYFSPTKTETLPEIQKEQIDEVNMRAKKARKKARTPDCKREILAEAAAQKKIIRGKISGAADQLDCFLAQQYNENVSPRYQALEAKIHRIAPLHKWPIPIPSIQLTESFMARCPKKQPAEMQPAKMPTTETLVNCDTQCPLAYDPICGINANGHQESFPSSCVYEVSMCKANKPVNIVSTSECDQGYDCDTQCPLTYAPICGINANGHQESFPSSCVYEVSMCKTNKPVKIVSTGECDQGYSPGSQSRLLRAGMNRKP